jgi:hypothetical protein
MRIERSLRNDVDPHEVFAMMCEVEYQERKCVDAGALDYDVTVDRTRDGAIIRARRTMPTDDFPGLLRKFVPKGVTSTETLTWGAASSDGSRTADLHVSFHATPASLAGTVRIVPERVTRTLVVVEADFRAHVPVVGRRVEGFAAPIILRVIDAEERTGRAWVARTA